MKEVLCFAEISGIVDFFQSTFIRHPTVHQPTLNTEIVAQGEIPKLFPRCPGIDIDSF